MEKWPLLLFRQRQMNTLLSKDPARSVKAAVPKLSAILNAQGHCRMSTVAFFWLSQPQPSWPTSNCVRSDLPLGTSPDFSVADVWDGMHSFRPLLLPNGLDLIRLQIICIPYVCEI